MSKKKSYMDRERVLNEGIISYALDKIYRIFYLNPQLKNNRRLNKSIDKLNKQVEDLEYTFNKELRSIGSKERVKIKPYSAKDILSGRK